MSYTDLISQIEYLQNCCMYEEDKQEELDRELLVYEEDHGMTTTLKRCLIKFNKVQSTLSDYYLFTYKGINYVRYYS